MKNLFLSLALILTGTFAFTNNQDAKFYDVNSEISSPIESLKLELDLGNLTLLSEEEIENKINDFIEKKLEKVEDKLDCSSIIIAKFTIGTIACEAKIRISGPCDEIGEITKKVVKALIRMIKEAINGNDKI